MTQFHRICQEEWVKIHPTYCEKLVDRWNEVKKRTKKVFVIFLMEQLNTTQNENETVPCGTNTENKHPLLKSETRLPKYDSQSGTTIDSCL